MSALHHRTHAKSRTARGRRAGAATALVLAILAGVWWLRTPGVLPARFSVVTPNALYRSGEPSPEQLVHLVERYRIRTIVDLRGRHEPGVGEEQRLATSLGVASISLPIASTEPPDEASLATLRRVYADPARHPILVHCEHGVARTGTAIAIWRIENEGWSGEAAVTEMIEKGFPVREQNASMRQRLAHWMLAEGLSSGGR